ncbi:hypothetical protein GCM10007108_15920 [Thermogymnomonas acidicola]|uniref:Prephenate dehydrogenase n=1 Tax=Thermogymnomonas acidicola TaxID=399579 RepID=A0AA37BSG2_9ARCH|nr:hypothetical protein [Thermogymnomonas acidicola]GGM78565.1 hypothetical protein GCM10007108_15920 [Thermogymnomonas acidicola]
MRIAVLGSGGRMGSTLMEVLLEAGHDVVGFHRHETEDMLYSLEEYDLAVLSIPPRVADEILSRERKYLGFVEVCASKSLMRKHSGRIISIHPLYGPMSYKEPSRRNTVLVKDISVEGSLGVVKRMLPRDRIIEMGFREHDEFVLHNLAVPYAVSLLASRLLGPGPHLPVSARMALESMASLVHGESMDVVTDMLQAYGVWPIIEAAVRSLEEGYREVVR